MKLGQADGMSKIRASLYEPALRQLKLHELKLHEHNLG